MKKFSMLILFLITISIFISCKDVQNIQKDVKIKKDGPILPDFSVIDTNGNDISYKTLEGYDLIVVNLWGSFCEDKDQFTDSMDKIQRKYRLDSVKVLGIIVDEDTKAAIRFIDKENIEYTNLIPDKSLKRELISNFEYVPVTLYIDKEGNIIKIIEGVMKYEDYDLAVSECLKR